MRSFLRTSLLVVFVLFGYVWTVDAAVLYQSKDEWFRLELSGYIKNFMMIQTGGERFLPSQVPKGIKDLQDLLKLLKIPVGRQSLQKSWDEFRRQLGTSGSDLMRIRSQVKLRFGEDVTVQLAYELRPQATAGPSEFLNSIPVLGALFGQSLSSQSGGGMGLGSFTNFDDRYLDLPRHLFHTYSFRLDHEIDRLFVSWALPFMDVTVGRQSVVFGVSQIFRPTDVLAPFSPQEIDKQERRGVDALKIEIPIGDLAELMLVGVIQRLKPLIERNVDQPGYFDDISPGGAARFKFTWFRFDIFLMTGYVQRDFVAGLGFSGSLFGAGFRGEAVYRYRIEQESDEAHPDGIFSASVGIDYNIGSKLLWLKIIMGLEYFHNGAGTTDPSKYLNLPGTYRFQRGEVFNLGSDYLALSMRWKLHPLLNLSAFVMLNLHDLSLLIAPSLEYAIKTDVSVFLASYIGAGEGPVASLKTNDAKEEVIDLQFKSEFGAVGMLFVLGARIYF